MLGEFVCQPHNSVGRMIHYSGGQPGFLYLGISAQDTACPADIKRIHCHWTPSQYHPGIGCIISNGVQHLAGGTSLWTHLLKAGINHLERRPHIGSGITSGSASYRRAVASTCRTPPATWP